MSHVVCSVGRAAMEYGRQLADSLCVGPLCGSAWHRRERRRMGPTLPSVAESSGAPTVGSTDYRRMGGCRHSTIHSRSPTSKLV
jgi:hypothetical protein